MLIISDASTQEAKVTQLKVLIYGEAGSGKTSLAFTAKKPLLLDFDNGSYRAGNATKFVKISKWADVVDITENDLKDFDTVIIDTAGQMLAVIIASIQKIKGAVKYSGELSIQGYGIAKSMFESFMAKLNGMGKDVILLAHDIEQKVGKGDEQMTILRPDIQGGSYRFVKRLVDLIGYMRIDENGVRRLNFNPTENTIGKNCADFLPMIIPSNSKREYDTYFADILSNTKEYLNMQATAGKSFYEYKQKIAESEFPEDFDSLFNTIQNESDDLKKQLRQLVAVRIKVLGITYDKALEKFIKVQSIESQVDAIE